MNIFVCKQLKLGFYGRFTPWLFCLVLLLTSVAHSATQPTAITIAISVTPLSAPLIIANEQGYFTEQGVDITFKELIGGPLTAKAMFRGEADMATSSETVVMFNSFERDDFAIAASFVESDNDVKIITTRQSGIRKLEDLAGRRVGTIVGSSAQFFLDHTMLMGGVSTEGMDTLGIKPENTVKVLRSGEVDAVVSWEPFVHLALQELDGEGVIVPHENLYTETFNLLVMRDWAKKNQKALQAVIRALIKASHYIEMNPDQAQILVANYLNKPLALIQATWSDFVFSVTLHQWLLPTMEAQARWAIERELTTATEVPNFLEYLLIQPLDQVDPDSMTVIH